MGLLDRFLKREAKPRAPVRIDKGLYYLVDGEEVAKPGSTYPCPACKRGAWAMQAVNLLKGRGYEPSEYQLIDQHGAYAVPFCVTCRNQAWWPWFTTLKPLWGAWAWFTTLTLEHLTWSWFSTLTDLRQAPVTLGVDDQGEPIVITAEQRARHTYAIGKSGSGKTTLLKNLTLDDIDAGAGVAYLDPHGDAVWDILGLIPEHRRRDVIYFAPARDDCPGLNPLAAHGQVHKVTSDLVGTLKRFFESWGPQLEMQLTFAVTLLLMDAEPHCFADLKRVFLDEAYRDELVERCPEPDTKNFWNDVFPTLGKTAHLPVINKLIAFLKPASPLQRLLSSTTNNLDVRAMMDEGKILLVNLSKGDLGEDGSQLLGALLVTAMSQAALSRTDIPEHRRRPFFLYVDEFQSFVNDSFGTILSEARKYKLGLILAHQNTGQVPSKLLDNITGNVATLVVFSVNADDAAMFTRELGSKKLRWSDGRVFDHATYRAERLAELDRQISERKPVVIDLHGIENRERNNLIAQRDQLANNPQWPPPPKELSEVLYPAPGDFQELTIGHAFVRRGSRSSTTRLTVPAPMLKPRDDVRDAILEQRLNLELEEPPSAAPPQDEDGWNVTFTDDEARTMATPSFFDAVRRAFGEAEPRPHQMPQDARTETETPQPTHQESTKTPEPPREPTAPPAAAAAPKKPADDFDDFLT